MCVGRRAKFRQRRELVWCGLPLIRSYTLQTKRTARRVLKLDPSSHQLSSRARPMRQSGLSCRTHCGTNCQNCQGSSKKMGQFVQNVRGCSGDAATCPPTPTRDGLPACRQHDRPPLHSTRRASQRGTRPGQKTQWQTHAPVPALPSVQPTRFALDTLRHSTRHASGPL